MLIDSRSASWEEYYEPERLLNNFGIDMLECQGMLEGQQTGQLLTWGSNSSDSMGGLGTSTSRNSCPIIVSDG